MDRRAMALLARTATHVSAVSALTNWRFDSLPAITAIVALAAYLAAARRGGRCTVRAAYGAASDFDGRHGAASAARFLRRSHSGDADCTADNAGTRPL